MRCLPIIETRDPRCAIITRSVNSCSSDQYLRTDFITPDTQMMTTENWIQAAGGRVSCPFVEALFVLVFILPSTPLLFINRIQSVNLIRTDCYSTGLEDRASVGVQAGRSVFAGFCLVGAGAAVRVSAVDQGFASECVEESIYPAAAGE